MSNIIKGQRIRKEGIIDFSERVSLTVIDEEVSATENMSTGYEETIEHQKAQLKETEEICKNAIEQAKQEAISIVTQAKIAAQKIADEAKQESDSIMEQARAKETQIIEEAHVNAKQIETEAYEEKNRIIDSSEGELVEVMEKLLQFIISEEYSYNKDWLLYVVKKMISDTNEKEELKIEVSEQVYNELTIEEKARLEAVRKNTTIEVSGELSDTSCRVNTMQGSIFYDISEGLHQVIKEIGVLKYIQ